MNYFSKNLRYLREKNTLTQDEMQPLVGIKKTTWSHYETGKSQPSIEVLIKISNFFGVTLNELIVEDLVEREGPNAIKQRKHKLYAVDGASSKLEEPEAVILYVVKEIKRLRNDMDSLMQEKQK
jgi:transcriptional regulator with XRE-family HTH domain